MSKTRIRSLLADTEGLSTVEYMIILCLIAIVSFAIWSKFANTVKSKTASSQTGAGRLPTSSY